MKNNSIVESLIENIKTDQLLLEQTETKIETAKDEKREVVDRLKDYRRDISVLLKYANESQQQKIEALGFDLSESERGLNVVASFAMDSIMKAKDNKLTNAELYDAYEKACKDKKEEPVNYTAFNIKCRTLFNTQRLIRTKGKDPKSSREDVISLNGRVVAESKKAEEKNDKPKANSEAQADKNQKQKAKS